MSANIAEPLAHHARAYAHKPVMVDGGRLVTYGELDPLVRRTASHLRSLDLGQGDVAGVALRDSIDHLVVLAALARAGIVILPLDWRWTPAEQARVATRFGAKLVLIEPDQPQPGGQRSVAVDAAWRRAVAAATEASDFPEGDLPLLMSLSSGTTGRPKGPRIRHSHFLARFRVMWINLGFNSQDRFLSATPLYYGGGRTFALLMLHSGATVFLLPPPYEPAELCAAVARHRISALFLVPTLIRRLLALPDDALAPLRSLRLLLSSGSALHRDERREIRARVCPDSSSTTAPPRAAASASSPRRTRKSSAIRWAGRCSASRSSASTSSTAGSRRARSDGSAIAARRSPTASGTTRRPPANRFATAGGIRATSGCSTRAAICT